MLIAIGHKARHGKDTVASVIERTAWTHGVSARIYSLSDALKAWCRVNGLMTKKDGELLQTVGTEVFRRANPDIWVNCLQYKMEEDNYDLKIIPDIRFLNEAKWAMEYIARHGGALIKVERYEKDGRPFLATDRDPLHLSEIELDSFDDWDYTLRARSGDIVTLDNITRRAAREITSSLWT